MSFRSRMLIRSLAAKTSVTFLAICPLCYGQLTEGPAQTTWGDAKIRIHSASEITTSDDGEFVFQPVPKLGADSKAESKTASSLLDPRFRGFPQSRSTRNIEVSKKYPNSIDGWAQPAVAEQEPETPPQVAQVKWVAPTTSAPVAVQAPQPQDPAPSIPVVNQGSVTQQAAPSVPFPPSVQGLQEAPVVEPIEQPAPVIESPPQGTELAAFDPKDGTFEGLQGNVKIIVDEKTGKLRVIGSESDIAIVESEIQKIIKTTETEERVPARIPLRYSESEALADSIRQIFEEEYSGRVGNAEIIPLSSPNALLVFGSPPAIDAVREIVAKIESDESYETTTKDFKSFALKHVAAADAKRRLEDYFSGGERGEAFPVGAWTVVADYRSNIVIVRGNSQVLQQARLLIDAIDVDEAAASTKTVKVFQLRNAVAGDLTIILQDAINGAFKNVPQPLQSNAQGGGIQPGQPAQDGNDTSSEPAPSKLQLQTVGQGGKVLTSGLLFDVRITPDSSSNSLIVRGPSSAMPLIEELIRQLDRLPNAETLIKVFQIVNGDAEQLLTMLEAIFGADDQNQQNQTGGLATLPLQSASATPGAALVNLRFAIEQRTNSIIATGPAGDLQVVEDLLNRLDEDLRSRRETVVYRLSNSNVLDVEEALNELLDSRSDVLANDPRSAGGAVLADQEIVIVPELASNSLIISALPENFQEIEAIITRLDRRPPMVKVKVLLAEVDLGSLEEFGIELGIQDSLLFDRNTTVGPAGGLAGTGFGFNTTAPSTSPTATNPGALAGQAISNLGVGTSNPALGVGGLVLSAGSESVSVLVRALKDRGCLRVLSRPHIMTLENLQGRVSVGQIVSRITGTNTNTVGTVQNSIEEREVGVILELTPRVSPDGLITMFVTVVKSSLGAEIDGPVVATDAAGNLIRQAPIDAVEAQTTIISRSGQTTVFTGLIQESKEHLERGTPILSDLPVIGPLFRFETDQASRSELMIIMTPYLVDTEEEVQAQSRDEMERMHWCLCDVAEVYGNTDFDPVDADTEAIQTVYPGIDQPFVTGKNERSKPQIDRVSQTVEESEPVKQVGFLKKMKLSLGDRIRNLNEPQRNRRNRRDFEDLKQRSNP